MSTMRLEELGWDAWFEERFMQHREAGLVPARVAGESGPRFEVWAESSTLAAETSGKFRHDATARADFPVVGDWVGISPVPNERKAVIHTIIERKNSFSRKEAGSRHRRTGGSTEEQVLASNIDTAFLVGALEGYRAFNPRTLERYLVLARAGDTIPVIVLNKTDLCPDYLAHAAEARSIAGDVPVCPVSALKRTGLEALAGHLNPGTTAVFLGPSGVGKSALINALSEDERVATGEVRAVDGRGRHTTTARALVMLPGGGMVIDTPGLRELSVLSDEEGVTAVFEDVEKLFGKCRFRDCRHESEPGCAVKIALETGGLDPARWENYLKIMKEAAFQHRRVDVKAKLDEKRKWKKIKVDWRKRQRTEGR